MDCKTIWFSYVPLQFGLPLLINQEFIKIFLKSLLVPTKKFLFFKLFKLFVHKLYGNCFYEKSIQDLLRGVCRLWLPNDVLWVFICCNFSYKTFYMYMEVSAGFQKNVCPKLLVNKWLISITFCKNLYIFLKSLGLNVSLIFRRVFNPK